jgi:hypothetical protein
MPFMKSRFAEAVSIKARTSSKSAFKASAAQCSTLPRGLGGGGAECKGYPSSSPLPSVIYPH